MKVPTYDAQLRRPTQGQGQFLTAQLNTSAMTAPGLAYADSGAKTAQFGQQIADFGFKKAQIGAEAEAKQASAQLEVELAEANVQAMQNPNVAQAESDFLTRSKLLVDKYTSKMSNTLARRSFNAEALRVQTRERIAFIKKNNERAVQQRTVNLEQGLEATRRVVADTTSSGVARLQAYNDAFNQITDALGDLGPEEAQKQFDNFNKGVIKDTLSSYISKPGADVLSIAQAFREGRFIDPMIAQASREMTQEELSEIADDLRKEAKGIVETRAKAREQAEEEANAENDAIYESIVNADLTNPDARSAALTAHRTLLAAGYYEKPSERTAIENLLDADPAGVTFAKKSPATDAREAELDNLEAIDQLTFKELDENKSRVTAEWYSQTVRRLQTERGDNEDEAIDILRDAYGYAEQSDAQLLKHPARAAFFKGRSQVKKYVRDNPKASKAEIIKEANRIVKQTQTSFNEKLRYFRQEQLRAAHTNLSPAVRAFIPAPTLSNIDEVKAATTKALANTNFGSDLMLLGFVKLLNEETALQLLD